MARSRSRYPADPSDVELVTGAGLLRGLALGPLDRLGVPHEQLHSYEHHDERYTHDRWRDHPLAAPGVARRRLLELPLRPPHQDQRYQAEREGNDRRG